MSEATLPRTMILLRLLESTIGGLDGKQMPKAKNLDGEPPERESEPPRIKIFKMYIDP